MSGSLAVGDAEFDLWLKIMAVTRGAWVAQLINHLTSAQVMISRFVSSSPGLGSVLTAQCLEPASDSVSPFLSAPPLLTLSPFLSNINKHCKKILKSR